MLPCGAVQMNETSALDVMGNLQSYVPEIRHPIVVNRGTICFAALEFDNKVRELPLRAQLSRDWLFAPLHHKVLIMIQPSCYHQRGNLHCDVSTTAQCHGLCFSPVQAVFIFLPLHPLNIMNHQKDAWPALGDALSMKCNTFCAIVFVPSFHQVHEKGFSRSNYPARTSGVPF